MFRHRRWHLIAAAVLALAVAGLSFGTRPGTPSSPAVPRALVQADPGHRVPRASKVAVMVLENRAYEEVIGKASAPYLNHLARTGSLATHYYALTHPSLPNYVALTTGSTQGVPGNCASCSSDRASLLNQLDAAKISWGAYFESLPSDKDAGVTRHGSYNKHYNPFVYTESLAGRLDQSRLRSFRTLRADLANHRLPRFSWIAPNVRHDGHNHPLRHADQAVARLVPKVLRELGPRGVLYLTWDESVDRDTRSAHGGRGGGRIALIAAGGLARSGAQDPTVATHVALLRTLEANLGLPALPGVATPANPLLTGLLRPAHPGPATGGR